MGSTLRYTLRHVRPSVESGLVWRGEREGMTTTACSPPSPLRAPLLSTHYSCAIFLSVSFSLWISRSLSVSLPVLDARRRDAQRRRRSRAFAESHELRREATVAVGPLERLFRKLRALCSCTYSLSFTLILPFALFSHLCQSPPISTRSPRFLTGFCLTRFTHFFLFFSPNDGSLRQEKI